MQRQDGWIMDPLHFSNKITLFISSIYACLSLSHSLLIAASLPPHKRGRHYSTASLINGVEQSSFITLSCHMCGCACKHVCVAVSSPVGVLPCTSIQEVPRKHLAPLTCCCPEHTHTDTDVTQISFDARVTHN